MGFIKWSQWQIQIRSVFPQTEIGTDLVAVRDYAQAVEQMECNHLLVFDRVLGANADIRPRWKGAYRHTDTFHEPFVLLGYLAGITQSIELVSLRTGELDERVWVYPNMGWSWCDSCIAQHHGSLPWLYGLAHPSGQEVKGCCWWGWG